MDKARFCQRASSELCRRVMTVTSTDCRERLKYEEEQLQAKSGLLFHNEIRMPRVPHEQLCGEMMGGRVRTVAELEDTARKVKTFGLRAQMKNYKRQTCSYVVPSCLVPQSK